MAIWVRTAAVAPLRRMRGVPFSVAPLSTIAAPPVLQGNHSTTQVPDFVNAKIGGKRAPAVIRDDRWLKEEFTPTVRAGRLPGQLGGFGRVR